MNISYFAVLSAKKYLVLQNKYTASTVCDLLNEPTEKGYTLPTPIKGLNL